MTFYSADQYYRNVMARRPKEALFDAIILSNGQVLIIPRRLSVLQTPLIIIFHLMAISIIIHLNITNITFNINNLHRSSSSNTVSLPMDRTYRMEDFRRAYHSLSQLLHRQWWMKFAIRAVKINRTLSIIPKGATQGKVGMKHCVTISHTLHTLTDVICTITIAIQVMLNLCHMRTEDFIRIHVVEVCRKA